MKLEIRKAEAPHDLTGWFDTIRHGIDSNDQWQFANGTFTTFTGRDGVEGIDQPARVVADPLDGQPAIEVKSVAASYYKDNLNEEGEVQSTTPMYTVREGNLNPGVNVGDDVELTNWQSQFFVTGPHVFRVGQKVRFVIEARAEHPTEIETQIHRGPGDYLHWSLFGNLSLTEDWQKWEFEQDITSEQSGGSTIAFNLNVYKDADNTYYFRNIELCVNEADVTEEERTLGSESILLPLPKKDSEVNAKFDLSNAVKTLGVEDFNEFILNKSMMLQTADGSLNKDAVSICDDGGIFDVDGAYVDDGGVISFDADVNSSVDNVADITIANFGQDFAADQTIDTRIGFVYQGWYYIYNVKFVDQAIYDGIENVSTTEVGHETVYDLAGRRVAMPTKGIYIKNGKKFVQR